MNYIAQLNGFWNWVRMNVITHLEVDLYLSILDIANASGWKAHFTIPNSTLGRFDSHSLLKARNRLMQYGLITYTKGKKNRASVYSVKKLYADNDINDMNVINNTNVCTNINTNIDTNMHTNTNTIHKQKQNETKRNNINPLIPFEGKLLESVNLWLAYKAERGQKYKPTGLQTLFKKIQDGVTEYGEAAVIRSIDNSIANNWQGLFFKPSEKSAESGNPFLDMLKDSGALEDGELF